MHLKYMMQVFSRHLYVFILQITLKSCTRVEVNKAIVCFFLILFDSNANIHMKINCLKFA